MFMLKHLIRFIIMPINYLKKKKHTLIDNTYYISICII